MTRRLAKKITDSQGTIGGRRRYRLLYFAPHKVRYPEAHYSRAQTSAAYRMMMRLHGEAVS